MINIINIIDERDIEYRNQYISIYILFELKQR